MSKNITLYKGTVFNGMDGAIYEIKVDTPVILLRGNGAIDNLMKKLLALEVLEVKVGTRRESNEEVGFDISMTIFEYEEIAAWYKEHGHPADDNLLFRLAVLANDNDVIFANGTLTWIDDILCLKDAEHTTPFKHDVEFEACYHTLITALQVLEDEILNQKRDYINVDVFWCNVTDAGYDLYVDFVTKLYLVKYCKQGE